MDGILFTIDRLGLSLAAAERRIAELEQEIARLNAQATSNGQIPEPERVR